jgi:hypothetical protein
MKKTLVAALAVLLVPAAAVAQTDPAAPAPTETAPAVVATGTPQQMLLGVDAQLLIPVGNFGDAAGIGIGALLRYEYVLMPKLNLTGRAGYNYHFEKNHIKWSSIPILVGVKYAITDAIYGAGELGLFNNRASISGFGSASENDVGLTLGAGYRLGALDVRVNLQFQDLGHTGDSFAITAGAGYNFWGQ